MAAMATPFRRRRHRSCNQELDAIGPTLSYMLSYQGWQKAVAEIEESYIDNVKGFYSAEQRGRDRGTLH